MIRLKDVTKEYGKGTSAVLGLDDISLDIIEGKFTVILGQSGCGKSTLMNLIGAIDNVSKGTIIIDEKDLTKMSRDSLADYRNKHIGFIFQAFHLEPAYTVLDNVCLPLIISNVRKSVRETRGMEVLEMFGLQEKAKVKANNLSGGQKQRVAIARALVHNPDIILADEPTGNLDSKNGQEVMNILKKIAQDGKTVIMVTHNLEYARMGDVVVTLKDGKIDSIVNNL